MRAALLVLLLCSAVSAQSPVTSRTIARQLGVVDGDGDIAMIRSAVAWIHLANRPPPSTSAACAMPIWKAPAKSYVDFAAGRARYWCQGMAWLLRYMLRQCGIRARAVAMFHADNYHTHAIVEAWDGGRWVTADPTYGVVWPHGVGKLWRGMAPWNAPGRTQALELRAFPYKEYFHRINRRVAW